MQVARLERQSELLDHRLQAAKQEAVTLAEATAATASQHSKQLSEKQVTCVQGCLANLACRHLSVCACAEDVLPTHGLHRYPQVLVLWSGNFAGPCGSIR